MNRKTWFSSVRPSPPHLTSQINSDNFHQANRDIGSLFRGGFVLLLLLVGQIGTASGAETGTPKLIRGVVTTGQGQPVAGVVVEICDVNGMQIATSATNDQGRFEISTRADQGEYELVITNSKQPNEQRLALGRQREGAEEFSTFLREAPGDPRMRQIQKILAEMDTRGVPVHPDQTR
jgi:Carboxypeptidase regulatory-like domain